MNNKLYYINNQAKGEDVPTYLTDGENPRAFKLKYVQTDGWRGFYEVVTVKKYGWQKTDNSDWVTGNWSDAGENSSDNVEAKLDKLAKELDKQGYDMAVIFTPTSNVFSTKFDVFRKVKK